eukprot:COSAG01_NODE_19619_length_1000_cov_0.904550_2_plen_98_part_01
MSFRGDDDDDDDDDGGGRSAPGSPLGQFWCSKEFHVMMEHTPYVSAWGAAEEATNTLVGTCICSEAPAHVAFANYSLITQNANVDTIATRLPPQHQHQ